MKYVLFLTLLLLGPLLFSQEPPYDPSIVILSPHSLKGTKSLLKEIKQQDSETEKVIISETDIQKQLEAYAQEPANIQFMMEKEVRFGLERTFLNWISSMTSQYLSYRFFEGFPNLLVYPITETSAGSDKQLASIAKREDTQYVLNIPSVTLQEVDGEKSSKIRVQLYSRELDKLVLDEVFEGNDVNPGFEFACENGSLTCTVNNAMSQALSKVLDYVVNNNPTVKRQRALAQKQWQVLEERYYHQPAPKAIPEIIATKKSSLRLDGYYQGFMNPEETQFVGLFFIRDKKASLDSLTKNSNNRVQVYLSDMSKPDIPQGLGRAIVGVKYKGKWFIEQKETTYFPTENLEQGKKDYFANLISWGFFEEGSTQHSASFWSASLFEKITDLTKDPDWDKYGDSIWQREEAINRPYIGLFKMVADELKKEDRLKRDNYAKTIENQVFDQFYETLKKRDSTLFNSYSKLSTELLLIYPADKSILLNPIVRTSSNGVKTTCYFIYIPKQKQLYQWMYLPETKLEGSDRWRDRSVYIQPFLDLGFWVFDQAELNDMSFWEELVLKKENGEYLYLQKVN